jgi:SAM-dependent methyltransferase
MITLETKENLWSQSELDQYKWYHCMKFTNGTQTNGWQENDILCDWLVKQVTNIDVTEKIVADVGCRDGLLSLVMEKNGAKEIIGIDNDLSEGASQLLIPRLNSKIQMRELNLYDIQHIDYFDITVCCGVLYHLRFPFLGLKKLVDMTKSGGTIYIEGGFMVNQELEKYGLCGCTGFDNSPYEGSSPIFFNVRGLIDTMKTFGCTYTSHVVYNRPWINTNSPIVTDRLMFKFEKIKTYGEQMENWLNNHTFKYWYGSHTDHTFKGTP